MVYNSIKIANKDYENWSGGAWLSDYGAEGLLVAEISRELIKVARNSNKDSYLTVEESFTTIFDCSGAKAKIGRPPSVLNGNFRADIVLWKSVNEVWGVFEIKRKWDWEKCPKDIERVDKLIKTYGQDQNGSIQLSCFAVFMSKGQDPDGKKLKEQYKEIKDYLSNEGYENYRVKTIKPYFTKGTKYPENVNYSKGGLIVEFY